MDTALSIVPMGNMDIPEDLIQQLGVFHSHGDTPTAGWLTENPNLKWMITGGTPMT